MYALQSELNKREYLTKLRQTFRNPFLLIGISFAGCLVTVFQSTITEAGEAGFHEITRLLLHPEDYYG